MSFLDWIGSGDKEETPGEEVYDPREPTGYDVED